MTFISSVIYFMKIELKNLKLNATAYTLKGQLRTRREGPAATVGWSPIPKSVYLHFRSKSCEAR